jgi:hypothetical protein
MGRLGGEFDVQEKFPDIMKRIIISIPSEICYKRIRRDKFILLGLCILGENKDL